MTYPIARIHSVETFGTLDGPGIRYVIFFQGCPLRCLYCHNRDTWDTGGGRSITLPDLVADIRKYQDFYLASGGGVTASGGEPALQATFIQELFSQCREIGLHTALDTSGYTGVGPLKDLLLVTDLVLLDIKHMHSDKHRQLTGVGNQRTLELAQYLSRQGIPLWVRYILIPGYTDDPGAIIKLAEFLTKLDSLQKVLILPYHTMGVYKWEEFGLRNPLSHVSPPPPEAVVKVKQILAGSNLPVE